MILIHDTFLLLNSSAEVGTVDSFHLTMKIGQY